MFLWILDSCNFLSRHYVPLFLAGGGKSKNGKGAKEKAEERKEKTQEEIEIKFKVIDACIVKISLFLQCSAARI